MGDRTVSGLVRGRARSRRIGIDHAVAADAWASHTGDMRLRAYCADGAAVAYAADGQRDACLAALDAAQAAVGGIGDGTAQPG